MAEFSLAPALKKIKLESVDPERCVFCLKEFTKKSPAVTPDVQKLDRVFNACLERQDSVSDRLLPIKEDIVSGSTVVKYHRNCRSSYQSTSHIRSALKKHERTSVSNVHTHADSNPCASYSDVVYNGSDVQTRSRLSIPTFDWKTKCFICSETCSEKHRNTWSLIEASIGNDSSAKNIYSSVLKAAQERKDAVMTARMLGVVNGDLVAIEARYHRKKGCLASYINQAKIARVHPQKCISPHKQALNALMNEYQSLIIQNREVFQLSFLRERYCQLLREYGVESPNYTSQCLKQQLQIASPQLAFVPQKGKSDLVCSADVSVGEVLQKAIKFAHIVKDISETANSDVDIVLDDTEENIVHRAVGILRERIGHCKRLNEEYYSSAEMDVVKMKDFVDPLLLKAVAWLTDNKLFVEASVNDNDVRCLSIVCDITSLSTSILSPKHIGLALHLHHEYGSRKLVETMHKLGYSMSYDEVRTFLTSAAEFVYTNQIQTPSGALVPRELLSKQEGGKQLVCVADNWDHNEKTVDGRRTTHAMTSILVTPEVLGKDCRPSRIPRLPRRTLSETWLLGGGLSNVCAYRKPLERPEPTFDPPVSLADIQPNETSTAMRSAMMTELCYNLARSGTFHEMGDSFRVPPWGIFHASLISKNEEEPVSQVAYNPILMSTPSDHSTVYTTLKQAQEAINSLGYTYAPIFFDMGLLTKALEISWSNPGDLSGVIPCDGGMHFLMAIFAGIGHLYGDAGLKNLLHESGVFAVETTNRMLAGKDFDRALYGLKLVDEVLHCRFFKNFMAWCNENARMISPQVYDLMTAFDEAFRTAGDKEPFDVISQLSLHIGEELSPLLDEFRREVRSSSPTFKLWDDILCKVLVPLKLFLSSSKTGSWEVYQTAKKQLLSFLFASGRSTYARYMPVLLLAMDRLPDDLKHFFNEGHFVAKLSKGTFNKVWMDYCLETTQNKALKGPGGIIGLTMKGPALARWFIARPITAAYSNAFLHKICKHEAKATSRAKSTRKRWDKDVEKMEQLFNGTYIDPFDLSDPPSTLVNIASGAVAPKNIEESMLNSLGKGKSMVESFVAERLIVQQGSGKPLKSFYAPMSRSNVVTMSEMKKTVAVRSKQVVLNGEIMYMRLLAINARKKIPLSRVMSFENAPVPLSLFSDDGIMLSNTKSDFMHKLEAMLPTKTTTIDTADAIIFDGHAIVHTLKAPGLTERVTFRDMASSFMDYLIHCSNTVMDTTGRTQLHVIFDHYDPQSIKGQTREKQNRGSSGTVHHVQLDGIAPSSKWKKFLAVSQNKQALARCYTDYMKDRGRANLPEGQCLFVSGGENFPTVSISRKSIDEPLHLQSNQEEADTRIVLHAIDAANRGAKRIVICSPDTDVFVLLVHHYPHISTEELYFLTGTEGKHTSHKRFIPVHLLYNLLSEEIHNILLPVYCLTGCDTVSGFYGHGKRSAFKIMQQNGGQYQGLTSIGSAASTEEDQTVCATKFIGAMYGKVDCRSLNSLRCEKALQGIHPKKLPPTDNSFQCHLERVTWQLTIWRQAATPIISIRSSQSTGFGYNEATNTLEPVMMTQLAAAPELLNDIICECGPGTCNEECCCAFNDQPCTGACSCKAQLTGEDADFICSNPFTISAMYETSDSDSD